MTQHGTMQLTAFGTGYEKALVVPAGARRLVVAMAADIDAVFAIKAVCL